MRPFEQSAMQKVNACTYMLRLCLSVFTCTFLATLVPIDDVAAGHPIYH
jgi:hypothetical protein